MKRIACLMSILLAACATTDGLQRGAPVPEQVTIVKACLAAGEVPAVPKTHVRPGMTHDQLAAAALADEADLEKYALKADGKLRACAGSADGIRND